MTRTPTSRSRAVSSKTSNSPATSIFVRNLHSRRRRGVDRQLMMSVGSPFSWRVVPPGHGEWVALTGSLGPGLLANSYGPSVVAIVGLAC